MNPSRSTLDRLRLARALGGRRWLRRQSPFPHVVAYDVLADPIYRRVEQAFTELLDGHLDRPYLEAHDTGGMTIHAGLAPRLHPLTSRAWVDFLAALLDIRVTRHVAVALHHHRLASRDGFVHNDLNTAWFGSEPAGQELDFGDPELDYCTGESRNARRQPIGLVRAAVMIFFVANPVWRPGDGGTTGLYQKASDPINRPAAVVPPINNSLLLFECTPISYHGFISNRAHVRNSLIMWMHQRRSDVTARWGLDAIAPYGAR